MAGSAGSPPVLTVYVCPKCRVQSSNPPSLRCLNHPHPTIPAPLLEKFEYVRREPPDALYEAADDFVGEATAGSWDPIIRRDFDKARDALREALDSYREATAGEGGDG